MTRDSAAVDCISRRRIKENCAYKTNKSRKSIILNQIFKITKRYESETTLNITTVPIKGCRHICSCSNRMTHAIVVVTCQAQICSFFLNVIKRLPKSYLIGSLFKQAYLKVLSMVQFYSSPWSIAIAIPLLHLATGCGEDTPAVFDTFLGGFHGSHKVNLQNVYINELAKWFVFEAVQ